MKIEYFLIVLYCIVLYCIGLGRIGLDWIGSVVAWLPVVEIQHLAFRSEDIIYGE